MKQNNTVRFWTEEEKLALKPYLESDKSIPATNDPVLEEFCKKYNRTYGATTVYIYTQRRKMKGVKPAQPGVRFYQPTEIEILTPYYHNTVTISPKDPTIKGFCKTFKRSFNSVKNHILVQRRKQKTDSGITKSKPVTKDLAAVNIKKGEFVIPIKNWEIRTENGQANLVLMFSKPA